MKSRDNDFPLWTYQTIGERSLPPVLFLHGFMGAGADWLPLAERWANHFYCLMPDLPGHGRNIHFPLDRPLDFERVGQGVLALLQHLHLDRVSLVGYSLGGRITLATAVKFPQHVRSLVLESCHAGIADEPARQNRAKTDDQRAEALLTQGMDYFVEQWYEMELFDSLKRYPRLLTDLKERRKKNDPHWMAKILKELSPGRQPPLWAKLGSLSLPVLLIAGELDVKYTELSNRMKQAIPEARVKIIPGAGHNVHLEKPEEFSEAVAVTLQSIFEPGSVKAITHQ